MLTPDQIDDFVNLTLPAFRYYKWTDISLAYQELISSRLIDEKNVKEQGGTSIAFKIKTRNTGNARNTGLYAADVTNVEDVTIGASVPWSFQTTNFSYDIYEDLFQSDRETIVRELALRDHDAMTDMAELNEENLWTAPTGTQDTRPMGIPFWFQKSPSSGSANDEGSFSGGNPAGFTGGAAGVDSTQIPRWRNWTFTYASPSTDDMVRKTKKSLAFTNFRAPVPHPELGFGKSEYNIYTTYRVQEPLERLAETRNDNLGSDVARYANQVMIAGVPVEWVPYLENNDTSDPLYGINWKYFRPFVKKGVNMRRNPPKPAARQHTVREIHIDTAMGYVSYNRRSGFVGSLSTAGAALPTNEFV